MFQPANSFAPVHRRRSGFARDMMPDLLSRIARDRDEKAFRELFDAFAGRIKSFMLRQGVDNATADELAQETLLTVWRKAALYSPEKGGVSTWIFTIARNLRIDRIRRETPWQELTDEVANRIPSEDIPVDDRVAEGQRRVRVQAVLSSLTPEQRCVVTLAYIEGLSHGQISERLGIPLGTVKSRMRLAYQKVRASLEDLR